MRFLRLSFLFFLTIQFSGLAQQLGQPPVGSHQRIRFEHLTTADGLPENSVICMLQDHLGFMWLGTQNGLVRYDGTTMTTFRYDAKKPFSLNGKSIQTLYEDRNGDIWVGCESLFRYERATGKFIEYPNKRLQQTEKDTRVFLIHANKQGNLWAITALFDKNIFVLDRLNPRTGDWTSFRHDPRNPHSLADDDIYSGTVNIAMFSFTEASDGTIWVVTRGQTGSTLHRFDQKADHFVRFTPKAAPSVVADFRKSGFVLPVGDQLYLSSYENGLFRLTPKTGQLTQFKHDPRNPASLMGDSVTRLFRSRDGMIWVPNKRSIDRLNPKTGQFDHYVPSPTDPNTPSPGLQKALHEMPNGDIWFVAQRGLNLYHRQSNRFVRYEHDPSAGEGSLQGVTIFSFLVDKAGTVWAGSGWSGVNKQSQLTQFPLLTHDPKNVNSLQSSDVYTVYEAPSEPGMIWFGTEKGLDRLDKKTGLYTHYRYDSLSTHALGKGAVTALAEDKKGRFWVGTQASGLFQLDRKTGQFSRYLSDRSLNPNESQFENIEHLLAAADGTLWLSNYSELDHLDVDRNRYTYYYKKANAYIPELFARLRSLTIPQRQVAAILRPQGKVDKTVPFTLKAPTDLCVVIGGSIRVDLKWDYGWIEDANGQIVWEMTLQNSKIDSNPNQRVEVKTLRLPAGNYRLRYKTDATAYYGSWPGSPPIHADLWGVQVLTTTPAEKEQLDQLIAKKYERKGLSVDGILVLQEDANGQIWAGANNGGICVINPAVGVAKTWVDRLNGPNSVIALLEDRAAAGWWVGDYANGLLFLDQNGKVTRRYNATHGLPGNRVSGIHPDGQGWLWLSTDNGVCRFNPKTERVQSFRLRNGIQARLYGRSFQTSDGELYFLGDKGVNAFYPSRLLYDSIAPPVVLTDLAINGQLATLGPDGQLPVAISLANAITLPHDQNDLTFNFAALSYSQGSESQYAYQLIPIDNGWVQNGSIRQARYSDLKPGTYTFRVKAANADGIWNEKGVSINVTISPPWWQTWWAYLLYALAFAALLRAYIVYRSRALRRENRLLEEKVALRTNQVQQQKEEIETQRDYLEETLTELKSTQDQLIQKEKLASLGELTAGIAHEIQNPLNFVNNFSEVSAELATELADELDKGDVEEAKALASDLSSNLRKINHHGQRASSIVKGMLEHSRTSSGDKQPTNLNALADEYLKIAYHGQRANNKNFNCELITDFDATLGKVELIPQDMGRVLLNLYNNAFYAVSEKHKTAPANYQPTISVSTQRSESGVEIRVSDNGTGIPESVIAKIFQPFFTTKPTGEGTGLGLSLSYDIVTKGHGGTLTVTSEQETGTEFIITLPNRA